ncbi:MAG: redoxin domain-containing protein [Chloroflexi bacterium]|nr:redoxin domain-containing protein [Chloroflexota bacterium]
MSTDLAVGSPAPDFSLTANDGRQIGLAEYKGKSHVVLFFVREYN